MYDKLLREAIKDIGFNALCSYMHFDWINCLYLVVWNLVTYRRSVHKSKYYSVIRLEASTDNREDLIFQEK